MKTLFQMISKCLLPLLLFSQFAFSETWSSDPLISPEEAEELHLENGNFGSSALQTYERNYGPLSDEQREQFLIEQQVYEDKKTQEWFWDLQASDPTLWVTPIGSKSSRLEIVVNKRKQRMTVKLNGKVVSGLANVKISTGKKASLTPVGTFSLKGKEIVKKRINRTYSTKKRKVYLEDAVQVKGGIFLHKASIPAQKNTLGRPASAGCVRIDREKSDDVFDLAKKYKSNAVVIIK